MNKKKQWRLGMYCDGEETTVQVQFQNRKGEWLIQSQYMTKNGMLHVRVLDEIRSMAELDYEQTYSIELDKKELLQMIAWNCLNKRQFLSILIKNNKYYIRIKTRQETGLKQQIKEIREYVQIWLFK